MLFSSLFIFIQVKRLSSKCQSEVHVLCCDVGLLSSVINRVGDDCLSVAQEASSTLDVICKTDTRALDMLFSGSCLADMKRVASMGDIFRYRIFEVNQFTFTFTVNISYFAFCH